MTLDINPVVPSGRQLIQAYGDRRFRISGNAYEGSVIVFPERTLCWGISHPDDVSANALAPVCQAADTVDILLIGCGPAFTRVPNGLRVALKGAEIVLEWMDTGAACRTFNVLVAEERRVAAALIAVD